MKKRLVVPLVGLAISFALPTYAQQKEVADPQTTQNIAAILKAFSEAHMNNDAAAIAALFTRDAVFVTTGGQSPVGKPLRDGMQTCCSSCTPKTAPARWTGMPFS